jgi:alpha-tubulin suppressor-like RCC1 family protein
VDGHRFVKVACGIGINIAVTAEGRVFAWGGALSRDLGSSEGGLSTYRTPLLLRSMAKHVVVDAACGGAHVLLVTKSGAVFSFGSGEAGALGQGFFTGDIRVPKKILALSDVRATAVAAGEYFSLVLTSEGHVYSFGRGDKVNTHRTIDS